MKNLLFLLFFLFSMIGCTKKENFCDQSIVYNLPAEQPQSDPLKDYDAHKVLTISEIIGNGSYVMLSDNSIWGIAPFDISISAEWITPAEITIKPSNHPQYPYLLYNHVTQDSIYARKASIQEVRQRIRAAEMEKELKQQELQKTEEKQKQLQITPSQPTPPSPPTTPPTEKPTIKPPVSPPSVPTEKAPAEKVPTEKAPAEKIPTKPSVPTTPPKQALKSPPQTNSK